MILDYASKYPDSYITAFEASSYLTGKEDLPALNNIFNKMNPVLQKWYYSEKINQQLKENKFGN